MNQKHILFTYLGIFQSPPLPQNFPLLPTSPLLPFPLPTSFTSFLVHSIAIAWESSRTWIAQNFEETWTWIVQNFEETCDTRLEEGGKFNVKGTCRGEGKRSASSQMQKWEKKGKLLPFSTLFFLLYGFFFPFLLSSFCLCLKWRRRWHKCVVIFSFSFVTNKVMITSLLSLPKFSFFQVEAKKTTTTSLLMSLFFFFCCYYYEQGDYDKLAAITLFLLLLLLA